MDNVISRPLLGEIVSEVAGVRLDSDPKGGAVAQIYPNVWFLALDNTS